MTMPPHFSGGIDKLLNFLLSEIFAAAIVRVLAAKWNFPIYSVWHIPNWEPQNRIIASVHDVNSPYKRLFTESFEILPQSAVHSIYRGETISKAVFEYGAALSKLASLIMR
jgi:hypothetical protein